MMRGREYVDPAFGAVRRGRAGLTGASNRVTRAAMLAALRLAVLGFAWAWGCSVPPAPEAERHVSVVDGKPVDTEELSVFTRRSSVIGAVLYVPVYPHIFQDKGGKVYKSLATTVSVHNISLEVPIHLTAVTYLGTQGDRLKEYVIEPVKIRPMETRQFVIAPNDPHGATGANFLVKWEADQVTKGPTVDAVMVSTRSQQGLSLRSTASVVLTLTSTAANTTR